MGTMLIVDDSTANRREIKQIMQETGQFTRILEAGDGMAGLRIMTQEGPAIDLVVCDINMPVMDGYKFLQSVRMNPSLLRIPVVIVSADIRVKDIVKAFELGAYDYITKPFIPPILRSRLENLLQIKHLQDQLQQQKDLMEKLATTDPLTELPNVRYFRRRLEQELLRGRRYLMPLALIMLDIDHFKSINDTYGHPQGDVVLKEMAAILQEVLRKVDVPARYGGEEFVVALPQTTFEGAAQAAERLRVRVEKHRFPGMPEKTGVTISLGVASYPGHMEKSVQQLIDEADQALYKAKNGGRNRVVLGPAPEPAGEEVVVGVPTPAGNPALLRK